MIGVDSMNNVIEDTCLKIEKVLSDNRDRDEIVTTLAVNRLCNLFNSQTATFDSVLDELLKSIDLDDMQYTANIIRRLDKCLNSNRSQLLAMIKKVGVL